jgi:hypothetical protein
MFIWFCSAFLHSCIKFVVGAKELISSGGIHESKAQEGLCSLLV